MTPRENMRDIALIGFGEAAQAFARGWGAEICARAICFDLKLEEPQGGKETRATAERLGVSCAADRAQALSQARLVFCLVTADQAVAAARACADELLPGTLWFDCNSCAPESKRTAAEVISAAGGRYVDVAVMAPVYPGLHRTPLLISGPGAQAAEPALAALDMRARRLDERVGSASAVKMLRSVMIKGMEALTAECFLAAKRAGVEAEVLGSLVASNPEMEWEHRAGYNLERMMRHGTRRAAEMREVMRTLDGLGMPSELTAGVADWQARIGAMGLTEIEGELDARAEAILERL